MKKEFVGVFTDRQLNADEDKVKIAEIQKKDPTLKYIIASTIRKKGKYVGIKVYLHDFESYNSQAIV